MFYRLNSEEVAMLREKYPEGSSIVVYSMNDPRPVPPGTRGTVRIVDDMGTIHCNFESGRRLGLIPGVDEFARVEK